MIGIVRCKFMFLSKLITKENILSFFYISFILALGRLLPHPPNFTPILAAAIVAPYMVNNKWISLALPLTAMVIADLFIGFHPYVLWVYGAIGLSTLLSFALKRFGQTYYQLGFMAIFSSLMFFFITNFSVWLVWDYYPKTFDGLMLCYSAGLPFFRNTLLSTILYTGLFLIILNILKNTKFSVSSYKR